MGDTWDNLSLLYYGNPTYYWVICSFNRVQDPFKELVVGEKIKIPTISVIKFLDKWGRKLMGSLISGQNRVESPFIIVQIGKYTFGSCEKGSVGSHFNSRINVTYPNFMQSITVNKVNGAINTYSIVMAYGIT